jgi:glycosyltransferase involved in cell wall biosynthesis
MHNSNLLDAGNLCPVTLPEHGLTMIIPAYNEEAGIANSLDMLLSTLAALDIPWEVVVVNDGSRDATPSIVCEAYPMVRLVSHPVNIGYGNALKTGIQNARYDWIGICDADGSYPSTELPNLLARMEEGFDMVVGYRKNVAEHDRWFKRQMRRLYIKCISLLTGDEIPDQNSGLRVFTKKLAVEFFDFLCGGFSFTTSLTVLAIEKPCFVKFIPIEYTYRMGCSKVQHLRDSMRTVQLIVQGVTYYNPIKFFIILSMLMVVLVAFPAMFLAVIKMYTLSAYYMLFGCVVALLLGLGVLGDIVRISAGKLKKCP